MRQIIHLDLDAFYASVEVHDHPEYLGKPVIVGGMPGDRSVVTTATYEARKYGIKAGMSIWEAQQKCPNGIFLRGDMEKYVRVAYQIFDIYNDFTPYVERVSIDEAFLDVTNCRNIGTGEEIAKRIKDRIQSEVGITVSAGVAFNKSLAKLGSDLQKPDGLTVITPENMHAMIDHLPVGRLLGVGKKTEEKLWRVGIKTIGILGKVPYKLLKPRLGIRAMWLWCMANGIDDTPVVTEHSRKSVGASQTFSEDTCDLDYIRMKIREHSERIGYSLRETGTYGKTVTLVLRYADFSTYSRDITIAPGTNIGVDIYLAACELLNKFLPLAQKVRLIGVSASNLYQGTGIGQLSFIPDMKYKKSMAAQAIDGLAKKHGYGVVVPASIMQLFDDKEKVRRTNHLQDDFIMPRFAAFKCNNRQPEKGE